jgi:allantoicase
MGLSNTDFAALPDLAVRTLGGSVVAANDELFAERENLIKPQPPVFNAHTFGHKGQVYDGWETRRRREPGHDWAIVRLGVPGVIRGVVVDTAFFTGNFPEQCSVEAVSVDGYPSPDELADLAWTEIVPRSPLKGDTRNPFTVAAIGPQAEESFTHVRLNIHPDGGVARLRVHGEVVPDPRWLAGAPLDLAALENGGLITDASNRFYSSPNNLLLPGNARTMGEGWETARRRDDANDWVEVRLAAEGVVRRIELDTTHFKGNAPGWFRLSSGDTELIARTRLQPDTRHRFLVAGLDGVAGSDGGAGPVDRVRVDVYPDGGFARLRVYGDLTAEGRSRLALNWYNRLPADHLAAVLQAEAGMPADEAAAVAAARPLTDPAALPDWIG